MLEFTARTYRPVAVHPEIESQQCHQTETNCLESRRTIHRRWLRVYTSSIINQTSYAKLQFHQLKHQPDIICKTAVSSRSKSTHSDKSKRNIGDYCRNNNMLFVCLGFNGTFSTNRLYLFRKICSPGHSLHHLLPKHRSSTALRDRGHPFELPDYSTTLHKKSFYCQCTLQFHLTWFVTIFTQIVYFCTVCNFYFIVLCLMCVCLIIK